MEGGIVIDSSPLRAVNIRDPKTAEVQAGISWGELNQITLPKGPTPPVMPDWMGISVGGGSFATGRVWPPLPGTDTTVLRPRRRTVARSYLPITRIENEPGTGVPWAPRPPPGGGGGAGPRSRLMVRMWFVLLSNVTVRAPSIV